MRCPRCQHPESRVVDSRDVDNAIRRRRECLNCGARFTTYERIVPAVVYVVKRDGRREPFSREKLLRGIQRACEKRPLATETLEALADEIEAKVQQLGPEVSSQTIGELVMERLKELDEIAYIRFASVYRQFKDLESLKAELEELEQARQRRRLRQSQPTLFPLEDLSSGRTVASAPQPHPAHR